MAAQHLPRYLGGLAGIKEELAQTKEEVPVNENYGLRRRFGSFVKRQAYT